MIARPWRWLLRQFDMLDRGGTPQYSKLVITAVLIIAAVTGQLTTALAIALLAAAFGRSVFIAFLCRTQIGVTDDTKRVETHETKTIVERRAKGGDFEATP